MNQWLHELMNEGKTTIHAPYMPLFAVVFGAGGGGGA